MVEVCVVRIVPMVGAYVKSLKRRVPCVTFSHHHLHLHFWIPPFHPSSYVQFSSSFAIQEERRKRKGYWRKIWEMTRKISCMVLCSINCQKKERKVFVPLLLFSFSLLLYFDIRYSVFGIWYSIHCPRIIYSISMERMEKLETGDWRKCWNTWIWNT